MNMTIKRKQNLDSYTSELLSKIPHFYEPHANALKVEFENCLHRPLKGSGHLLEKVIFGYFDEILPHQIHLLASKFDYLEDHAPGDDFYAFDISDLSDDIVQQLQVCKSFVKSSGETNGTFYSYKNKYQIYGYLSLDKSINKYAFLLGDMDAFLLNSNGSPEFYPITAMIDKEDDTARVKVLKDFMKVLRSAGIHYLDLGRWIGENYGDPSSQFSTRETWPAVQERHVRFRPQRYLPRHLILGL